VSSTDKIDQMERAVMEMDAVVDLMATADIRQLKKETLGNISWLFDDLLDDFRKGFHD
jgi:hypothetical protein